MRPFFSFFGSKWSLATKYPTPRTDVVVEPFAGAAGYSVRHGVRRAILVEKDPVIAAVWRYLIAAPTDDVRALPDLPQGGSVDDLDIPQAAQWLIGFWLNKGCPTPRKTASAWMRDPRYAGQFWGPKIRERIATQVDQIREWTIIEGDYTSAPDVVADWFIDPPYIDQGRQYRHGSSDIDFKELGWWCVSRRGRVVVCEQEGAAWLPFEAVCCAKATTKKGGEDHRSHEVAWIRGPQ